MPVWSIRITQQGIYMCIMCIYIYSTYLCIYTYVSIHLGYQFWPVRSLPFNFLIIFKNCRKLYRACKFNFLLEIVLNIFQSSIYLYTSTRQLHWRRRQRLYKILLYFCRLLKQFGNIRQISVKLYKTSVWGNEFSVNKCGICGRRQTWPR